MWMQHILNITLVIEVKDGSEIEQDSSARTATYYRTKSFIHLTAVYAGIKLCRYIAPSILAECLALEWSFNYVWSRERASSGIANPN